MSSPLRPAALLFLHSAAMAKVTSIVELLAAGVDPTHLWEDGISDAVARFEGMSQGRLKQTCQVAIDLRRFLRERVPGAQAAEHADRVSTAASNSPRRVCAKPRGRQAGIQHKGLGLLRV